MPLRDYQQEAHDAVLRHIRKSYDSCVIDCPTGAGKSHINAAIASSILELAPGKKVLCLAPSKELVEQNHSKFLTTGHPASIYSASAGRKELKHPVVFGSPLTVANNLQKFGSNYAAVVIDEAHGTTPTIHSIVRHIKEQNKKLRVIGMSATCYRLGNGYIYGCDFERGFLTEEETINPFFDHLVYRISPHLLIERGFLTTPVFEASAENYDTGGLVMTRKGTWDADTVNRAFVGHDRKTSRIVADVVAKSLNLNGVMLFAATVQHGQEIMASLPPGSSALVTGSTKTKEREDIISRFKSIQLKYLVSIGALTTGFDASHVDHIAILRATESASLLQQIIGRGLRIEPGKTQCLISDYAGNIERHFPGGDVFAPEIKTRRSGESQPIDVPCPQCGHVNDFKRRPNPDELPIDDEGFFVDLMGERITEDGKEYPAHFGRRCTGWSIVRGNTERCPHKWSFKECPSPSCGAENDIAARYCTTCKGEIVDPNEKLKEEAAKIANSPNATKMERVKGVAMSRHLGKGGRPDSLRVIYATESDNHIDDWIHPEASSNWLLEKSAQFMAQMFGENLGINDAVDRQVEANIPTHIAYRKEPGAKHNKVIGTYYDNS